MKQVCRGLFALAVIAGSTLLTISMPVTLAAGRGQQSQSAAPALTVPADLTPLLVGPASEMRLVVTRYLYVAVTSQTWAILRARPGPVAAAADAAAVAPDPRRRPRLRCRSLRRGSRV